MTYVIFHMWERFRKQLIASHQFYVDQAQTRLLSQFKNMEEEANKYADEWLEKTGQHFDPDRHDPGDFYVQAHEESIEFYQMLEDMLNRTRLSVLAGIFHEWDKQLRDWIVKEGRNWGCGNAVNKSIWKANFVEIINLLEAFGWEIRTKDYFSLLDKYRLVVNAYKHGNGGAFEDLKTKYPEFIQTFGDAYPFYLEHADHTDLIVGEAQIAEFSNAIVEFWKDAPEYIYEKESLNVPDWFAKAYDKDQSERTKKVAP